MKTTLRSLFACAAAGALAVSLAGCGPDDNKGSVSTQMALADGLAPGWSMMDLAGVDPGVYGGDDGALPEALPMAASYGGGDYGYAPSYDYAPDDGGSDYKPLDDSYYYDDSYDDGYYDEPYDAGYDDAGSYDLDGDTSGYALLAVATALAGVIGDAPPDYGFGYDGVSPWAWQTGDRYSRYAEPVQGGYRYYYYEPDSYRPFFVSDPYYSYGYRDDRVVAVYDRGGRRIDARRARLQLQAAKAYYARADRLYRAAQHDRHGVSGPQWARQRETIRRDRNDWIEKTARRPGLQQWEARNAPKVQRQWASEALVRRDAEHSFAKWQRADYRTPAPTFYTPQVRQDQVRKIAEVRQDHAKELADRRRDRTEKQRELRQEAQQRIAARVEHARPRPAQPAAREKPAERQLARIERKRAEPNRPPTVARPARQTTKRVAPERTAHVVASAPHKVEKPRAITRPDKPRRIVTPKPKTAPARVEHARQVRAAPHKAVRPAAAHKPTRDARVERQTVQQRARPDLPKAVVRQQERQKVERPVRPERLQAIVARQQERQKVERPARPERPKAIVARQPERASPQPQARPNPQAAISQRVQAQAEKRQQARQERQDVREKRRETRNQRRGDRG